jgi:hypothetical protein
MAGVHIRQLGNGAAARREDDAATDEETTDHAQG